SIFQVFKFILRLLRVRRVWLGSIFSLTSLCIWLYILSRADLNFAFSLGSMHYILIAFSSKIFLGEKVGLKRLSGTILIIIGIILVSLS
ncbi:MAG: EamA family transporter, partial [Candidatus Omnitrophota bacterium]|nr:EamA family transporter [Candidatus Omnitrophota bacterium]